MRNKLKKNDDCIISYHIILHLGAKDAQTRPISVPKIHLSSKEAKFVEQIWIDLALIFCMNDFFCAIASFWDMIDFFFFLQDLAEIWRIFFLGGGHGSSVPPLP